MAAEAAGRAVGEAIDGAEFASRIGPPLREEFGRLMPETKVEAAIDAFRRAFVADGLVLLRPLAGADALFRSVREAGLEVCVITSRIPTIAAACLDACELRPDSLVGGVSGLEKAAPLQAARAVAYVGDHPLDMHGAHAAGVFAIGITTGSHGHDDLVTAGAHDHGAVHFTFFHFATRDGVFYGHHDHVTDAGDLALVHEELPRNT